MTTSERVRCGAALAASLLLSGLCFCSARVLAELDGGRLPLTWVLLGSGAALVFPAVLLGLRPGRRAVLASAGYVLWVLPSALALLLA